MVGCCEDDKEPSLVSLLFSQSLSWSVDRFRKYQPHMHGRLHFIFVCLISLYLSADPEKR